MIKWYTQGNQVAVVWKIKTFSLVGIVKKYDQIIVFYGHQIYLKYQIIKNQII